MEPLKPQTPAELAEALATAAGRRLTISLDGAGTKARMHDAGEPAAVAITTAGLNRIIEYEPRDLTIGVEAGCRFAELAGRVAADGLMLPLDPPFFSEATIGGTVAANASGPRRRQFGAARDLLIGVEFATVEGKLVQSGGMVVKNAAGLDLGKLMVGSHGTLAAVTVLNFRLSPKPPRTRTFVFRHDTLEDALRSRNKLTGGVLQPAAVDLLNPAAAARGGLTGYVVAAQAAGSAAVVDRYTHDLPDADTLDGDAETGWWEQIREFVPGFLAATPGGAVVRLSTTLSGAVETLATLEVPVLGRAGGGILYACFEEGEEACRWVAAAAGRGLKAVVEYVPEAGCDGDRWPLPGSDFAMMERIKRMLDPDRLLNRGRLYGRL